MRCKHKVPRNVQLPQTLTLILLKPKEISLCHQYRTRPACTSMQSEQALYCWLSTNFILISQTRAQHAEPTLISPEPSFYLKFLVKKRNNSKTIAFKAMSLVLQLQLDMMSKYSKFSVDTFTTFWVMSYIKAFAWHWRWQRQFLQSQQLDFFFKTDKL